MAEEPKPFRLLDLPPEIRILILRQIVGNGFINLAVRRDLSITEPYVYIESITNKPDIYNQDIRYHLHPLFDGRDQSATLVNPEKILSILRTCHSLHDEGSPEVYSTNIFAFHAPDAFQCFLAARTPSQRSRLAVSFTKLTPRLPHVGNLQAIQWHMTLTQIPSDWLSGLRTIHLHTEVRVPQTAIYTAAEEIFLDLDGLLGETLEENFSGAHRALQQYLGRIETLVIRRRVRLENIPMTVEVRVNGVRRDDEIYKRAHDIYQVRDFAESQREIVGMRDRMLRFCGGQADGGVESGESEGRLGSAFKAVPKIFLFGRPSDFDKKGPGAAP